MSGPILIVTGLKAEARIAAGEGCIVVAGGGDRDALEARLAALSRESLRAVVSFGIAGALVPGLRVGDVVLPNTVRSGPRSYPTDPSMSEAWMSRLAGGRRRVRTGALAGVDAPVGSPAAKIALGTAVGAVAVDMESHVAAAFAETAGVPFGAIRVISDGADRLIPPVAAAAMRPDGSVDVLGLTKGLVRDPGQIPALVATARDAAIAFRTLRRVRGLLGPSFGLQL